MTYRTPSECAECVTLRQKLHDARTTAYLVHVLLASIIAGLAVYIGQS